MTNFEINKTYLAIVTGYSDTTDGKYKVYIPSLMSSDRNFKPLEAKNRASNYGKWINPETNQVESIGNYIPLQIGMRVEVVFENKSLLSAKIVNFWYDDIPLDKSDQDTFYLLAKTKKGTLIYSDDKRNITQILHNGGKSCFLMMDDKINISLNETSNVSNNLLSAIELTPEAITFKVGDNIFQIDETGFNMKAGSNIFNLTKKDIALKTDNLQLDVKDNLELKAKQVFITAKEEMNLKSTTMRISGNQHFSITGNVLNIAAKMNATISSDLFINLKALTSINYEAVNITSVATALNYVYGASACFDGITTVLNGTTTAINGTTIFEDSQIIRGLGAGAMMASNLSILANTLRWTIKATDTALVTGFHFSDPFSGMASNAIGETIPGVAQGCPNQMPIVTMAPSMDYINSTIKYINSGLNIGNIGTIDHISGLSGNEFKNVYLPENKF